MTPRKVPRRSSWPSRRSGGCGIAPRAARAARSPAATTGWTSSSTCLRPAPSHSSPPWPPPNPLISFFSKTSININMFNSLTDINYRTQGRRSEFLFLLLAKYSRNWYFFSYRLHFSLTNFLHLHEEYRVLLLTPMTSSPQGRI